MAQILVVDDQPALRDALSLLLTHHGHTVDVAETAEQALTIFQQRRPDLVIMDIVMPGGLNGVEALAQLKACDPQVVCVFVTAFGSVRSAVDAMQAGGFDYVTKPFDNDDLLLTVGRALERRLLTSQVHQLREDLATRTSFPNIVGRSPAIEHVVRELAKVATSEATVLLLGESGTGKDLAALSVHRHSRRSGGPFVAVNCGAIPATLAESQFFGHERGAFTDAKEARAGFFEQAHGGTLFLDEVGELPLAVQAMLLRVLEERTVTRLGARRAIQVDVRVVAATNRDLADAVRSGQFREDLYWRLSGFTVSLPPLRDRLEDVDLLTDHLLDRLRADVRIAVTGLTERARERLRAHRWPGNVRELENVLRRAMIMVEGPVIGLADLSLGSESDSAFSPALDASLTLAETVARAVERIEQSVIDDALRRAGGNHTAAAAALGIDRRTLFTKLRRSSS